MHTTQSMSLPEDITRQSRWRLPSNALIEIRKVTFDRAHRHHIATVRTVDINDGLSHGSFDLLVQFIRRHGKKVKK